MRISSEGVFKFLPFQFWKAFHLCNHQRHDETVSNHLSGYPWKQVRITSLQLLLNRQWFEIFFCNTDSKPSQIIVIFTIHTRHSSRFPPIGCTSLHTPFCLPSSLTLSNLAGSFYCGLQYGQGVRGSAPAALSLTHIATQSWPIVSCLSYLIASINLVPAFHLYLKSKQALWHLFWKVEHHQEEAPHNTCTVPYRPHVFDPFNNFT